MDNIDTISRNSQVIEVSAQDSLLNVMREHMAWQSASFIIMGYTFYNLLRSQYGSRVPMMLFGKEVQLNMLHYDKCAVCGSSVIRLHDAKDQIFQTMRKHYKDTKAPPLVDRLMDKKKRSILRPAG